MDVLASSIRDVCRCLRLLTFFASPTHGDILTSSVGPLFRTVPAANTPGLRCRNEEDLMFPSNPGSKPLMDDSVCTAACPPHKSRIATQAVHAESSSLDILLRGDWYAADFCNRRDQSLLILMCNWL